MIAIRRQRGRIKGLIYILDKWYQEKDSNAINEAWKNYSSVLNNMVTIQIKNSSVQGKIVDLDIFNGIALEDNSGKVQWYRGEIVEMLRLI